MKHQRYINAGTIDLSTIRIGQEVGGGSGTQVIYKPLTYPVIKKMSTDPSTLLFEEGTTNNFVVKCIVDKGSYNIASIKLTQGGATVGSPITSVTTGTEYSFNVTGVTAATTYKIIVTDEEGYETLSNDIAVKVGKRIYYGILPSDHDVLITADKSLINANWIKANCQSFISTTKTFNKLFDFETNNNYGFAVIAIPKVWTKSNPDLMTIDILGNMQPNEGCYVKTLTINSIECDIYVAPDRSKFNIKYGIK